ncbi:hypothetical protein E3U47_09615 [Pseudomonas sp. RIT623]|nr:hypothetical protein E3U47_09615 [Pseudomonas sp. RIT623]
MCCASAARSEYPRDLRNPASAGFFVCFGSAGAALQPFRGARPLLQAIAFPCRSGLVPRKGRGAPPRC